MKLIADIGATKAAWTVLDGEGRAECFAPGVNFALVEDSAVADALDDAMPEAIAGLSPEEVWVYAAGCGTPDKAEAIRSALTARFPGATAHAHSDMLGAARAVCGHSPGIACILGTGSNAALYSPDSGIVLSTPPLGYILGDEGSAADLGKAAVNAAFKGLFEPRLAQRFLGDNALDKDWVINRVYTQPRPNVWLGSLAKWLSANIDEPQVQALVTGRFSEFLIRNVLTLPGARELPVGFAGSIAAAFSPQLADAAQRLRIQVAKIVKSPADGLAAYHSEN